MSGYYGEIPEVTLIEMRLTDGRAKVFEEAQEIEIEPWVTERGGTMRFFKEDAAVLRYLADALESFDIARPVEAEEGDEQPEPKRPQIVTNGKASEGAQLALK